jgi:nitrate reductase NapE component
MTTNSNSSTSNNSNKSEHGQGLVCFIFILFMLACFLLVAYAGINGDIPTMEQMGNNWDTFVNGVNSLNVKIN